MRRFNPASIAPLLCLAACAGPSAGTNAEITLPPPGSQALIGATPKILDAQFGQPTLLRVEGTAQVWLYHSASCGLNLFLYPDASGMPRVTMATAADGSPVIGDCPASLQQSHIDAVTTMPATAALEPPASS